MKINPKSNMLASKPGLNWDPSFHDFLRLAFIAVAPAPKEPLILVFVGGRLPEKFIVPFSGVQLIQEKTHRKFFDILEKNSKAI
jgi:hypothetical protein